MRKSHDLGRPTRHRNLFCFNSREADAFWVTKGSPFRMAFLSHSPWLEMELHTILLTPQVLSPVCAVAHAVSLPKMAFLSPNLPSLPGKHLTPLSGISSLVTYLGKAFLIPQVTLLCNTHSTVLCFISSCLCLHTKLRYLHKQKLTLLVSISLEPNRESSGHAVNYFWMKYVLPNYSMSYRIERMKQFWYPLKY